MKRFALLVLFAALTSCATTGATTADLSPELQSRWDACEPSIARWCRVQAHGDPAHELECKRDARRGYASASTEQLRARYLVDHGCTQQ
ncbi:MAG: hypothetical protein JNK05_01450 [Myxococcales bacterium]|nr:hypothetical protein [Myxococcales bacterium]